MSSVFREFATVDAWLSDATLPEGHAEHPKFSREVTAEIAARSEIDDPNMIHVFWVQLTRAAHEYDRLKGISFNTLPAQTRDDTDALLRSLEDARRQIDQTADTTRRFLDGAAINLQIRTLDYDEDWEARIPGTLERKSPPACPSLHRLANDIDAMINFLKESQDQIEPLRRGAPPNFALKIFVRYLLNFWAGTLQRTVTADHNPRLAYSPAPAFVAACAGLLDEIEDKTVLSAVRNWRTDKK